MLESDAHHTLVLGEGDFVEVENSGNEKLHFVLIAGQPLNEPVVQHGELRAINRFLLVANVSLNNTNKIERVCTSHFRETGY